MRVGRVEGGVVVGVGCGVGHIAHAVGCSFPFFLSPFLVFFGSVLWHGVFLGVSVCGGMYHLPLSVRFCVLGDGAVMVAQNQPVEVDFEVFFRGFV